MNSPSRTISGIAAVVIGIALSYDSFLQRPDDWLWGIAVGLFFIGVGIFIFFNTKEDDIEQINDSSNRDHHE